MQCAFGSAAAANEEEAICSEDGSNLAEEVQASAQDSVSAAIAQMQHALWALDNMQQAGNTRQEKECLMQGVKSDVRQVISTLHEVYREPSHSPPSSLDGKSQTSSKCSGQSRFSDLSTAEDVNFDAGRWSGQANPQETGTFDSDSIASWNRHSSPWVNNPSVQQSVESWSPAHNTEQSAQGEEKDDEFDELPCTGLMRQESAQSTMSTGSGIFEMSNAFGLRCQVKNTFLDVDSMEPPRMPQRKTRSVTPPRRNCNDALLLESFVRQTTQ
jgi:hypothetical protein